MEACRSSSPETLRKIWSIISSTRKDSQDDQFMNSLTSKAHAFSWTPDQLKIIINRCVAEKLVIEQSSLGPGAAKYDIPDNVLKLEDEPSHDWYCFECHRPGTVRNCISCFRVYHNECLPYSSLETISSFHEFKCPVCLACEKSSPVDQNVMINQLDGMLTYALNKLEEKGGVGLICMPNSNSNLSAGQYRMLIARHIDLNTMKTKVKNGFYSNPRHFLGDFHLLVHNAVILYGKESVQTLLAKGLLEEVEAEINTIGREMTLVPSTSSFELHFDGALNDYKAGIIPNAIISTKDLLVPAQVPKKARRSKGENGTPSTAKKRKRSDNVLNSCGSKDDDSQVVSSSCETTGVRKSSAYGACGCEDKFKRIIQDLQRSWLNDYKNDREVLCVELTQKLHADFENDQEKLRKEMLQQFKLEMESTKNDLDQKYTAKLQQGIQQQQEKHKALISETKKKQWCWQCESEAIYHCCWNTSYCSVECQQQHWPQHRKYCRRKKQSQH